jgi:1,2-phenylacetyl-CoA epoxidase PaaB subunit
MIERNPSDPRYKIDYSKKVFVYKNLHKDCWSVKQDGLVKAHTEEVRMWDCAFQVNAKGRQKVLDEQRKNVHAGIKGYIDNDQQVPSGVEVTYNPYKYDSFVDKATELPIYSSQFTTLTKNKVVAV